MGMDYYIECLDCKETSNTCEFSIVPEAWSPKNYAGRHHPEELQHLLDFIQIHSGHRLRLIDGKGNETKPHEINGAYVLGLKVNP